MKRPLLQMLREKHGFSERRACEVVGLSRSVARYECRPDRDEEVIAVLLELAERLPELGFDKLFLLIRRRGLNWNHKRGASGVLRIAAEPAPARQEAHPVAPPSAAGSRRASQCLLVCRLHVGRARGWSSFPHLQCRR